MSVAISTKRRFLRPLACFATLATAWLGSSSPPVDASTADLDFRDCSCAEAGRGACQHFLRNPAGVTDEPCWCDRCRNTPFRCDGRTVPPDWNPTLFETGGMDSYLKRHAVAWGVTCSECLRNDRPWPDAGGGSIGTVPEKDFGGRSARATVLKRLEAERRLFKRPEDVVVAYDEHFYVVTDIDGLKVRMPGGSSRFVGRHEWAHLMIERAEFARREWVRNLGEPLFQKPIALYFTEKQRDLDRIGAEYFRAAGSKGLRGGGAELVDGMCLTGIALSRERTGDDEKLHVALRHMLSHNLWSIWGGYQTRPKALQVWIDEGLAHWLTKSEERFRDDATYCIGEGQSGGAGASGKGSGGPSWSGKDWDKDVSQYVQGGKLVVIEELMAKLDVAQLTEEDEKRAWSYCDLCLTEWREPFVRMLRALRKETDAREAFTASLGLTPGQFDERWKQRVLGRRRSMAPQPGDDDADAETPGARDRRSIRAETHPQTLAAKVRALGEVADKKTLAVVVDVMAQNSDLVRETAFVTLLKTNDKECREILWTYGLAHPDAMVRAYAAKLCGRLRLDAALPKLEAQLEDKNWYARAEAAVACGLLKDVKAMAGLRLMADADTAEKARVGAMDALAMFHEDAGAAAPLLAKALDHPQWQIRIAAAQALGEIGSMESVDPLVARMEKETGRVRDDVYEALKKITRDDLGRKPESWRRWWDAEKRNAPDGRPKRPPEDKQKPKVDPNDPHATHDAGPPPYFGIELYSNRVAFVVDTSESMLTLFNPDPSAARALSRAYLGRDKLTICKEEVEQALRSLDPRSHFNVIAFGTQIRAFQRNPVPASTANVDSCAGFLRSLNGRGETNYYDALKVALDLGDEPDTKPDFRATPDTITFLTDGAPTKGDIVDGDTLLEWYTGLNRYARVRTHTITFGTIGIDMPLLRNLADRNGGRFTLVPELRKLGR